MSDFKELLEAFNDFNLREAAFDVDEEGAEEYFDFVDDEYEDEDTKVVDTEAETEEEVEEGEYLDDIALQCKTCRGIILKKEEDVKTEDDKPIAEVTEEDVVNAEEECPLCGGLTGFCVLGKIVPYVEVDVDVEEEEGKEDEEKVDEFLDVTLDAHDFGGTGNDVSVLSPGKMLGQNESCEGKKCKGKKCIKEKEEDKKEDEKDELQEAVNKFAGIKEDAKVELDAEEGSANVKIDDTNVDIDTKETDDLAIGPIEDETAEVIEDEPEEEEGEEEVNFDDIDIDEIEEESLERAYVKAKPFCEKFRVRDVYHERGKIVVEGIAKLRNGDRARSRFTLTPRNIRGEKATFVTEGLGLRDRCFGTLTNRKIVVESFKTSKKNKK